MRSALYTCWRRERPRRQPRCWGQSKLSAWESSVFWRTTTPSTTYPMFRHIWLQFWWQWIGIHSPLPSMMAASLATLWVVAPALPPVSAMSVAVLGAQPASPTAAVAADAFKKSRRFMPLSNRAMNITLLFSCLL